MRRTHRRLLSYVLLATYAGISFLGEGLHQLMPDGGHHHINGLCIITHSHEAVHADHDIGLRGNAGPAAAFTANDCDIDSHLCEICAFLFQTLSQPAEVAAPIDWQPIVVVAAVLPQSVYTPISLGPQAPRGPPLLLA